MALVKIALLEIRGLATVRTLQLHPYACLKGIMYFRIHVVVHSLVVLLFVITHVSITICLKKLYSFVCHLPSQWIKDVCKILT